MVMVYDYFFVFFVDKVGMDIVFVGDLFGMVVYGEFNIFNVSME